MRKQGIKCEYGVTSALVSLFFFTPSSCSFFSLFSVKNNWSVVDAVIRVATMNQRDEPLQKASYYARSRRRSPNTEAPAGDLVTGSASFSIQQKDSLIVAGESGKHGRAKRFANTTECFVLVNASPD
jgi:hypothetical protein